MTNKLEIAITDLLSKMSIFGGPPKEKIGRRATQSPFNRNKKRAERKSQKWARRKLWLENIHHNCKRQTSKRRKYLVRIKNRSRSNS